MCLLSSLYFYYIFYIDDSCWYLHRNFYWKCNVFINFSYWFIGVHECPEHMHRINSECRSTPSQRTCDEPVAQAMGVICDWSRCDCDFPFVLHLPSGYCFTYEDCPWHYTNSTQLCIKENIIRRYYNKLNTLWFEFYLKAGILLDLKTWSSV